MQRSIAEGLIQHQAVVFAVIGYAVFAETIENWWKPAFSLSVI